MSPTGLGTILITGGGSQRGIGRATALRFAGDGNAVAPAMVDTDITGGVMTGERKAELAAGTLTGRLATTIDVANAVAFLAAPDADCVTGATIDVSGGSHLH